MAGITAHELWKGAFSSRDPEGSARAVERFLAAFDILPYDDRVARVGGRLAAALAAGGKPIGDLETMIAATAIVAGATLVTRSERHFRRVADLRIRAIGPR